MFNLDRTIPATFIDLSEKTDDALEKIIDLEIRNNLEFHKKELKTDDDRKEFTKSLFDFIKCEYGCKLEALAWKDNEITAVAFKRLI